MKTLTPISLAVAIIAGACQVQSEEDIAASLEQENGGMTMDDEAPQFDDADAFSLADIPDEDATVDDELADDSEVEAMRQAPTSKIYHAAIHWGQIPLNLDEDEVRVWDGTFRLNRGAIIVRRTIAFEGLTDRIRPRQTRDEVSFRSRTVPHRDGMRLLLIDPTPEASEPLTLSYSIDGSDAAVLTVMIDDLLGSPHVAEVDNRGNKMLIGAIERPQNDACAHGFLSGRWHQLQQGRGHLIGRVVSADGALLGHMRGVWGERANGDKVFFGKYINRLGEFKGLFRGTYENGAFQGRWIHRSGELGALGGQYRETAPGQRVAGRFLGRFAETSCNIDVGADE